MDNIILSSALMIAILSTTNVFATTPEPLNSNLLPLKIKPQAIKSILADLKEDKFTMPGSERMFNPQPEPPGNAIKTPQQGGDKTTITND